MSYIKTAKTPTLIQHGELDRRVPIANAYELRQGLEDRGVKVEMWFTKASVSSPNQKRCARDEHNLSWFKSYLGRSAAGLYAPEVPKKETKDQKQPNQREDVGRSAAVEKGVL
jgi:fermentation-respiration switch protein FrsA (DUF1100 family)